jgi:DNA (cytosine-5)-methyltransferase 1
MRFGSVCSGIEAASVAWEPLGWQAAWFSEIEPFPCAVLQYHYPAVPNHGDMTALPERIRNGEIEAPDMLCGGTPCQAFSIAGLRRSLLDDRGNLTLTYVEIANAIDDVRVSRGEQPAIIFWENVPGVLNTDDNAFGCFLGALAGETVPLEPPGKRWTDAGVVSGPQRTIAWRVLDAQHFGVAQRRKRIFLVASARDDIDCAAILFESEGVRRDSAPSRTQGQDVASHSGASVANNSQQTAVSAARLVSFGEYVDDGTASAIKARDWKDATDLVSTYDCKQHHNPQPSDTVQLTTENCAAVRGDSPYVYSERYVTSQTNRSNPKPGDPCLTLTKHTDAPVLVQSLSVRRLTPRECERLQGFPDNYTAIPWNNRPVSHCPDGPRYKAIGNSWAVPVVRWIGRRIDRSL